ncbi:MAG: cbb3-type cytochrome oxidase subunit 3 [Pseudomonadota bacterium]|jgi:cytochrome c oxidase cbb3-type subunit 4
MELGTLRSLVTLVSLVMFVGIVWWAYARRNKSHFDEAARLPLSDD